MGPLSMFKANRVAHSNISVVTSTPHFLYYKYSCDYKRSTQILQNNLPIQILNVITFVEHFFSHIFTDSGSQDVEIFGGPLLCLSQVVVKQPK